MLRKTVYSLEDASLKEPVGEEAGFEEAEIREYLKVLNGTERMVLSLSVFGRVQQQRNRKDPWKKRGNHPFPEKQSISKTS